MQISPLKLVAKEETWLMRVTPSQEGLVPPTHTLPTPLNPTTQPSPLPWLPSDTCPASFHLAFPLRP